MNDTLRATNDIDGTGRVGTCFADRETLTALFGEPHYTETDPYGKTSHEWAFAYQDGARTGVFTLYDYDRTLPYSVGGKTLRDLAMARAVIGPAVRREMNGVYLPKHLRAHFGQSLTNWYDKHQTL